MKSEYLNSKYETNPKSEFSNVQNKVECMSDLKFWSFGFKKFEFV